MNADETERFERLMVAVEWITEGIEKLVVLESKPQSAKALTRWWEWKAEAYEQAYEQARADERAKLGGANEARLSQWRVRAEKAADELEKMVKAKKLQDDVNAALTRVKNEETNQQRSGGTVTKEQQALQDNVNAAKRHVEEAAERCEAARANKWESAGGAYLRRLERKEAEARKQLKEKEGLQKQYEDDRKINF